MNNDITYEKDGMVFNYRIAIIIKKENQILVQKDDRAKHLTLPGGRCSLGESSIETAIREFKEETGINTKFKTSVGMIENFFTSSFTGKKTHEILIINELEFLKESYYQKEIINNIEEKKDKCKHLTYIWLDIEDLKQDNFKPNQILDMLDQNKFQHIINKNN